MKTTNLFCVVAVSAMTICGSSFSAFAEGAATGGHTAPHWTYSGAEGPDNWGTLATDYHACSAGKMQSPIDLSNGTMWDTVSINTNYTPAELEILHNGHTVQFNIGNGSTMTSHGKEYALLQIHFHTPSEHTTNGKPAPMEAHFVHKAADGALAVLGVFYVEGAENAALKAVFDNLPGEPAAAAKKGVKINPSDILPASSGFYRYMGSLTTPPCSEGVNWFVLKKPTTASKEQIAAMTKAIGPNARPVKPMNNRLLMEPWN